MSNIDLSLTSEDYNVILDALDYLKTREMTGEFMGMMLESLAMPGRDASDEEKIKWEEHMRVRKLDREFKEDERKKQNVQLDTIKAKILLGGLNNDKSKSES